MKVDPQPKVLDLTDDELFDYPFVYMIEVGSLEFTEEEVVAVRRYLLNGGFLMVTWGWGIAVFSGVYVAAMSGAHLNPAVVDENEVGLYMAGVDAGTEPLATTGGERA